MLGANTLAQTRVGQTKSTANLERCLQQVRPRQSRGARARGQTAAPHVARRSYSALCRVAVQQQRAGNYMQNSSKQFILT